MDNQCVTTQQELDYLIAKYGRADEIKDACAWLDAHEPHWRAKVRTDRERYIRDFLRIE